MVNTCMFNRIKDCMKRGLSQTDAAEELGLDRGTVARFSRMSREEFLSWQKKARTRKRKFTPFQEEILAIYEANLFKPLNTVGVYDVLEEAHGQLPGSERSLRTFIRHLELTGQLVYESTKRNYEPVPELPFGQQLQIDFGVYKQADGRKWHIFAAVLSASRYKFALLQEKPFTTRDLLDALLQCFETLGGMPRELVVDQDRLLMVRENYGEIIYTDLFRQFIDEMDLQMRVCRKCDPESKGKVEATVHYIKGNFFAARQFNSLEDANHALWSWLKRRANGRISEATRRIPADVFETEREHLRPLKSSVFRLVGTEELERRLVDKRSRIKVKGSTYAVPDEFKGRQVAIRFAGERIQVLELESGTLLRDHPRVAPGQDVPDPDKEFQRNERLKIRETDLLSWYPTEAWELFVAGNRERYPRYLKGQFDYGNRHLRSGMDTEIFAESLEFCLNNETFSMTDLHDTYRHFATQKQRWDGVVPVPSSSLTPVLAGPRKPPQVAVRGLDAYRKLIHHEGGVRA